jgi:hypothetical protein
MKIRADREVLLHLAPSQNAHYLQKDPVVAYEEAKDQIENTK